MRPENDSSVGGLLRQLTHEVPSLITKELALAKAELTESIRATKAGAASVASGGAVLLGGFIILLMSAVYGLSEVMAPWLAALIVGGVVVVIGLIMVSAGKKKFEASSFKPERTLHSMNKDKEAVRGHTS
ncbi:phage holin family protein [Pseudomonas stutzeri]|nr:phage holin family protein [Stutzerimonas stutzeri]